MRLSKALMALSGMLLIAAAAPASANPCLIFVHGKQTDTNTYTSYTAARNYWRSGSQDFIKEATRNFAASFYVIGYNGTRPWWDSQAAGEVANKIVAATNGSTDGGGNKCAKTYSQGGTFWVIAHSMGGTIMDFILGNSRTTDPNYNFGGAPYSTVANRISLAITTGGAHRGSEAADAVCGGSSWGCNFMAWWVASCDDPTWWLRSADDVQVRTYSNAPAKNIYLTGGYKAIFGPSACLSGEDDGIVQHASQYACNGSANASYNNSNVCNNSYKQKPSGFRNLDVAHENHDEERNDSRRATRKAIPDGIWMCGGSPCSPDTNVQSSMSTAQFVGILY
jgi:hypothetical protein